MNKLKILGTRGIPAAHGGFETFAEYLSIYLVNKNWHVTVYCQADGVGEIYEDEWQGVHRVFIPVNLKGSLGTILFDFKSTIHSVKNKSLILTLGYNTAIFFFIHRLLGVKNITNMDGIEWKRQKWSKIAKIWFWLNERVGCYLSNHLIADNPGINQHLSKVVSQDKISTIPYGANRIKFADSKILSKYGVEKYNYAIVIARPEPEHSILEIVSAWSTKKRNIKLMVLGKFEFKNSYHQKVLLNASDEVLFPGAIYEKNEVSALRFFSLFYIHGHQVGGTNPSLVEALGAANAILAHKNIYNSWVANQAAIYFTTQEDCSNKIDILIADNFLLKRLRMESLSRHSSEFTWEKVLNSYEKILINWQ
jgi:glycosyltransferase involved in cell wall biosynthesis